MEEAILDVLNTYSSELPDPLIPLRKKEVEIAAYKNWAFEELVRYLKKKEFRVESVQRFRDTMTEYSEIARSKRTFFMFAIAVCVADDILDRLNSFY